MSTGWSSLPIAFATVLYSYEGMSVVSSPILNNSFSRKNWKSAPYLKAAKVFCSPGYDITLHMDIDEYFMSLSELVFRSNDL